MDKIDATKTLARVLTEKDHINIMDSSNLVYYVEKARSCFPVSDENGRVSFLELTSGNDFQKDFSNLLKDLSRLAKELGANYMFFEDYYWRGDKTYKVGEATPYAVISDIEEKILRETFYKDVPSEIEEAMESLKIDDYRELYSIYTSIKNDTETSQWLKTPERPIKVSDVVYSPNFNGICGIVTSVEKGMCYANAWYRDICLREEISSYARYAWDISEFKIVTILTPPGSLFMDFVFTLPESDQNIEANNVFLRQFMSRTSVERIMLDEYQKEGHFMDYFSVLEDYQKSLVERIRALAKEEQKTRINAQLFDLGFDGLYLQFLDLYQNNPKRFVKYLVGVDDAERREIIERLYTLDEDKRSKETDELLEKKYRDLIEEVGIKRIKE